VLEHPEMFHHYYGGSLYKTIKYPNGLPNEILAGRLYLGSEKQARHKDALFGLGITHVVNCTKTIPNFFEP
jgi:hypothetical protein